MANAIASVPVEELMGDLAYENPPPEERWFIRDEFDPMHGARELRAAAKRGWIELDDKWPPEAWRFRLTPAGRAALAEHEKEMGK